MILWESQQDKELSLLHIKLTVFSRILSMPAVAPSILNKEDPNWTFCFPTYWKQGTKLEHFIAFHCRAFVGLLHGKKSKHITLIYMYWQVSQRSSRNSRSWNLRHTTMQGALPGWRRKKKWESMTTHFSNIREKMANLLCPWPSYEKVKDLLILRILNYFNNSRHLVCLKFFC